MAKRYEDKQVRAVILKGEIAFGRWLRTKLSSTGANEEGAFVGGSRACRVCCTRRYAGRKPCNAQDAIRLWIDTGVEFGDPVPKTKGFRLIFAW